MTVPTICPRCAGFVGGDHDDIHCFNCAWRPVIQFEPEWTERPIEKYIYVTVKGKRIVRLLVNGGTKEERRQRRLEYLRIYSKRRNARAKTLRLSKLRGSLSA